MQWCADFLVKIVVPMGVCVYIAFTAFALEVKELGARLAIVGPAAVALTALQILVVATDVQVGSCSWLAIQLPHAEQSIATAIAHAMYLHHWKRLHCADKPLALCFLCVGRCMLHPHDSPDALLLRRPAHYGSGLHFHLFTEVGNICHCRHTLFDLIIRYHQVSHLQYMC